MPRVVLSEEMESSEGLLLPGPSDSECSPGTVSCRESACTTVDSFSRTKLMCWADDLYPGSPRMGLLIGEDDWRGLRGDRGVVLLPPSPKTFLFPFSGDMGGDSGRPSGRGTGAFSSGQTDSYAECRVGDRGREEFVECITKNTTKYPIFTKSEFCDHSELCLYQVDM